MPIHRVCKISILMLTVVATVLILLPASTAHAQDIGCNVGPICSICFDQCVNGTMCHATVCTDGTSTYSCSPCYVVKLQPGDFRKGTTHEEKGDKAILAQLLSKDPEVSQALRSLK